MKPERAGILRRELVREGPAVSSNVRTTPLGVVRSGYEPANSASARSATEAGDAGDDALPQLAATLSATSRPSALT
jgi:hypothetical protein